jgi:antitoxin component of MazEF toxin-antitoxin module
MDSLPQPVDSAVNWSLAEETMATQIARIGGTVTVEIPEELLRQANLAVGDPVEWTLTPAGALALHAPHAADVSAVEDGYEEWKLAEIQAGLAEAEAGETVSHEKVISWLRSWGTGNELPPPL